MCIRDRVGAVSHGVLFPKHRGDLVQTAVVVEQMRAGGIEALQVPANPLDVLAQQIVAMTALDEWAVDDLFALVRRSASYATLTRPVFESVLDMLSGRYPVSYTHLDVYKRQPGRGAERENVADA